MPANGGVSLLEGLDEQANLPGAFRFDDGVGGTL
jgi:hypothetical protein